MRGAGRSFGAPSPSELRGTFAPIARDLAPAPGIPMSPPKYTVVTTFQSGHGWAKFGAGTGTVDMNDTTDKAIGSQSAKLMLPGTGGAQVAVAKTGMSNMDLTGKHLALLIKVDNPEYLQQLTILAGSGGFASYYSLNGPKGGTTPGGGSQFTGQWQWVHMPFVVQSTTGTPSRSTITDIQVRASEVAGAGPASVVHLGAVAFFTPSRVEGSSAVFPNGVCTIEFDDIYTSQYSVAMPILDRYLFRANVNVIVDAIGSSGTYLTLSQLKEMRDSHAFEIAAHAYTLANHNAGYDSLTTQALDTELASLKGWAVDNGFEQGAQYLAWPLGRATPAAAEVARKYFKLARGVQPYPYQSPRIDQPMLRRSYSVPYTESTATINGVIDAAYAEGAWLTLVFHKITPAGGVSGEWSTASFTTVIDYLQTKGIPVRTVSEVLSAMG